MNLTFFRFVFRASVSALAAAVLGGSAAAQEKPLLRVTSDFPGGSARVLTIDQTHRVVHLNPEPYPDKGWDCWWYFRLDGVEPGETIELNVGKSVWATPDRAMFSADNKSWKHTLPGERNRTRSFIGKEWTVCAHGLPGGRLSFWNTRVRRQPPPQKSPNRLRS